MMPVPILPDSSSARCDSEHLSLDCCSYARNTQRKQPPSSLRLRASGPQRQGQQQHQQLRHQPHHVSSSPPPPKQQQQHRRRRSSHQLLMGCCLLTLFCCSGLFLTVVDAKKKHHPNHPYDPNKSRLVGQFLHITDIHPDEHYITHGTISTSCHRLTEDDTPGILHRENGDRIGGFGFSLANTTTTKSKRSGMAQQKDQALAEPNLANQQVHFSGRGKSVSGIGGNSFDDEEESADDYDIEHWRSEQPPLQQKQQHHKSQQGLQSAATIMSDIMRPGRTSGGVGGKWGAAYSICDSPFALSDATFAWIDKHLIGKLDFVVWTGDNARHDSDNERPRSQKEIENLNMEIANKFLEVFAPDPNDPFQQRIPIVPSIGNNDVYPHNIMEAGPNRILQHFSEIWSDFIPESQFHTFQHGGYYITEVVPGKISVAALNTLYFFNQNAAVDGCLEEDEPGTDQLDWLEVELVSIRKRKMVVYLSGHVPPARKSYSPTCYTRYTEISLRFQDVIVGHLFGHANIDHFFLLSEQPLIDPEDPSPSTTHGHHHPHQKKQPLQKKKKYSAKTKGRGVDDQTINNDHVQKDVIKVLPRDLDIADRYQELDELDEEDRVDFEVMHLMGLSSYLLELWEQYRNIPEEPKLNDYVIVNVAPSVIPTYNPALRVYGYQLAIEKKQKTLSWLSSWWSFSNVQNERVDGDEEEFSIFGFVADLKKTLFGGNDNNNNDQEEEENNNNLVDKPRKKKPKKPSKKPKPHRHPNPPPTITFGFPLNYTQYWTNLTWYNQHNKVPIYEVEYTSFDDYGLANLGTLEWLKFAKRVVGNVTEKEQYMARMVVLTGTENEEFLKNKK